MNSPNVTTVPLPPAKGRSIGRIRADQALGACPGRPGTASKLGKIRSPQMGRIHRPLRPAGGPLILRPFPQVRQLSDIGGDASGFGLVATPPLASWLPSVPRNGRRGPPSVQPQATHYVLLVRPRLGLLARPPRARRRLLPALQARLASPGRALRVAVLPHAAPRALLSRRRWLGAAVVSRWRLALRRATF